MVRLNRCGGIIVAFQAIKPSLAVPAPAIHDNCSLGCFASNPLSFYGIWEGKRIWHKYLVPQCPLEGQMTLWASSSSLTQLPLHRKYSLSLSLPFHLFLYLSRIRVNIFE